MAHSHIDRVLKVDDIGPQRLPLNLLDVTALMVSRPKVARRYVYLRLTGQRVRIRRAKHGRVLSDEDSTLSPGLGRRCQGADDESARDDKCLRGFHA